MGEFSIVHWLVVLIVVMILFGPKKLPEIARAVGESVKEFKKSLREGDETKKFENEKSSSADNL